ncbi:MAG: hypothetical protein IJP82_10595 [Bacteroidaceae bacterium]|nr:hypothetical protein [Bacteroidaceae bacterium]
MGNREQVTQLVDARDWTGVERLLGSLSNMELRRMERVMREEVLTRLDNGLFWETLLHIIIYKRAAFLSGVVAVEHLARDGTLDFGNEWVKRLYEYLRETNEESLVKLCSMMMPLLHTEKQVEGMFKALHVENEVTKLLVLLKVDSTLSYYLIFKTLKLIENKTIARKCCMAIIKRQNDMAYNAVSLIKAYFGLEDLPARFSLKVEEYELSHIDRNFDTFLHVLNGKRPRIDFL